MNKLRQFLTQFKSPEERLRLLTTQFVTIYNQVQTKSEKKQIKTYIKVINQFYDIYDKPNFTKKDIKQENDVNVLREMAKYVIQMMIDENIKHNTEDNYVLL